MLFVDSKKVSFVATSGYIEFCIIQGLHDVRISKWSLWATNMRCRACCFLFRQPIQQFMRTTRNLLWNVQIIGKVFQKNYKNMSGIYENIKWVARYIRNALSAIICQLIWNQSENDYRQQLNNECSTFEPHFNWIINHFSMMVMEK